MPGREQVRFAVAALIYLLLTPLMVWAVADVLHPGRSSFGGDALLNTWAIAWNHHVLGSDPSAYFDGNIFHPHRGALALSEHLFTIGLFTVPLAWLRVDALLTYDLAWLASFPLSGLAAFLLAGRVSDDFRPRLAAGAIYAFNWFRIEHALHIQLLWAFGLPLSVWLLLRWRDRLGVGSLFAWALAVTLQCLVSWYLAVLCLAANGTALVWLTAAHVVRHRRVSPRAIGQIAAACLSIGVVLGVFASPYRGFTPASLDELRANSALLTSYVLPPSGSVAGAIVQRAGGNLPPWSFERSVYVGLVPLLLAGYGLAGLRALPGHARTLVTIAAIWAVVALLLSLGPLDDAAGVPSPYGILSDLPGVGAFRVPARFALLVSLAVAVLAAARAARMLRLRGGAWLLACASAVLLVDAFPVSYAAGRPHPVETPGVYRLLARVPPGPLLSLPSFVEPPTNWFEADYLYFSTRHWLPIVNGYSRIAPPPHPDRMRTLATFPCTEAVEELRRIGVAYVVVHNGRYGVDLTAAVEAAGRHPQLSLVGRAGPDSLWAIRR